MYGRRSQNAKECLFAFSKSKKYAKCGKWYRIIPKVDYFLIRPYPNGEGRTLNSYFAPSLQQQTFGLLIDLVNYCNYAHSVSSSN